MLVERTLKNLEKRRENILNGYVNSIPTPFKRFRRDFVGLEQKSYLGITSFTKTGKTQFTLFLLFEALLFVFNHKDKARMKVFYYILEETDEGILNRFMSFLLYKLAKIRVAPRDLRRTDNDNPVSETILNKFNEEPYKSLLKFFEETFVFSTTDNALGIYTECVQYAKDNGTIHYSEFEYIDEMGQKQIGKNFDHYEPNDPHEFRFVVIDHMSLLQQAKGETLKMAIDEMSKFFAKYLRNRYGFSPIGIQQQSIQRESNDSVKIGRTRPDREGLADSKSTVLDENLLLGLYSPAKFGLKEYMGYDISRLKDKFRIVEVIASRDGEIGGLLPLYFDGATNTFWELPRPDDPQMEDWYRFAAEQMKESHSTKEFILLSFSRIKNIINGITNKKK